MTEKEPGYSFQHNRQITLEEYQGIASNDMDVNDPVADGFMRVGDIRGDVVIVQRTPDRVTEYDELGYVKVGRGLKMPSFSFKDRSRFTSLTRDEDATWYIEIDDQDISRDIREKGRHGRDHNKEFFERFGSEVRGSLRSILNSEKLVNGNGGSVLAPLGYGGLAAGYGLVGMGVVSTIVDPELFKLNSIAVSLGVAVNYMMNKDMAKQGEFLDRINMIAPPDDLPLQGSNDPFVRKSPAEYLLPTVPLDRLVRGHLYLLQHGKELILDNSVSS